MVSEDHRFSIGELMRTKGGSVAHLATCRVGLRAAASSRNPWNYVAGRTLGEVRGIAASFGVTLCRRCLP